MPEVALRGIHVELRPLRPSDARSLGAILRDRRVTRLLPPRVRHENGKQFVTRVLREQRESQWPAFVIRPIGSDEVIGQIRFIASSPTERSAEVGYWIRRAYWGQGFGTDALRLICRFGFGSMVLHRIEATVVTGNNRSRRALKRVGFREEGRRRRSALLSDRWADEWVFGLLRGETRGA